MVSHRRRPPHLSFSVTCLQGSNTRTASRKRYRSLDLCVLPRGLNGPKRRQKLVYRHGRGNGGDRSQKRNNPPSVLPVLNRLRRRPDCRELTFGILFQAEPGPMGFQHGWAYHATQRQRVCSKWMGVKKIQFCACLQCNSC